MNALPKKAPLGDVTRTQRAKAHLKRLEQTHGKRLLVDLDAEGNAALGALLESGYGSTQKAVVNLALIEASERIKKT